MSIAGINVDTRGAGGIASFDPIPNCKPEALIQGYEIKDKAGAKAIHFTFLITAGEHKGRKLFDSATIFDPNPASKAVGYGMSFLKTLGAALGYAEGSWDDAMLNNTRGKRVIMDVKYEGERKDRDNPNKTYPPRNRIVGFEPVGGAATGNNANVGMQMMQPVQNMQPQQYAAPASAPPQQYAQPPQTYAQQPVQNQAYAPAQTQPQYAPQPAQQPVFHQQPLPTSLQPQANYAGAPPQPAQPAVAGQPTWMTGANG